MDASYIGRQDLPPGLRNNNPGNIRPGDNWQGMIGTNNGFIVFQSMYWGLRALATDLVNKINEGANTIAAIIAKYAPATDNNNVQAYIDAVSQDSGFNPDQELQADPSTIHALVRAISNHEIGTSLAEQYISDDDIDQGIAMMNNKLWTLVQAAGIAAKSAISETVVGPDGSQVNNGPINPIAAGGILLAVGGIIYFGYKGKKTKTS